MKLFRKVLATVAAIAVAVTAIQTTVMAGNEVETGTYTVSMSASFTVGASGNLTVGDSGDSITIGSSSYSGFTCTTSNLTSGLTVKGESLAKTGDKTLKWTATGSGSYTGSTPTFSGSATLVLNSTQILSIGAVDIEFGTPSKTAVVTNITGVTPTLAALEIGKELPKAVKASGEHYTIGTSWNATGTVEEDTTYTATVTLKADTDYNFSTITSIESIADYTEYTVSNISSSSTLLTFTVSAKSDKLPTTGGPELITSVAPTLAKLVIGDTLPTAAAATAENYKATETKWDKTGDVAASTTYIATVTLAAESGYVFNGITTLAIDGYTISGVKISDSGATLTFTATAKSGAGSSGTTTSTTTSPVTPPTSTSTTTPTGGSTTTTTTTAPTGSSTATTTTTAPETTTLPPESDDDVEIEEEKPVAVIEVADLEIDEIAESILEIAEKEEENIKIEIPEEKIEEVLENASALIESIKGSDVELVLDCGDFTWTIDGSSVDGDLADINLNVSFDTESIKQDIVEDKLEQLDVVATQTKQISLAHDGEFGFKGTLTLKAGKEFAGQNVIVYYNNKVTGKLEISAVSKVNADGTSDVPFNHASDYLMVISEDMPAEAIKALEEGKVAVAPTVDVDEFIDSDVTPAEDTADDTNPGTGIALGVTAAAITGTITVLASRKKRK